MTDTQTDKFTENWNKNYALFGQKTWTQEADFCHYIQAPIPLDTAAELFTRGQNFKAQYDLQNGVWRKAEDLHLTITLPGRLGSHFQKNDLRFMKQTLEAIAKQTPAFPIEIGDLNVFPHSIFAEVSDPSGRLQQLHETLCNEIPFSQHPEFRYQHYLPHITLAYGCETKQVLTSQTARAQAPLKTDITTLHLGKAKWQGSDLEKVNAATFTLK